MRVILYLDNHLCIVNSFRIFDCGKGDLLVSVAECGWDIIVHDINNVASIIEKTTLCGYVNLSKYNCEYLRKPPMRSEQPCDDMGGREINSVDVLEDFEIGL